MPDLSSGHARADHPTLRACLRSVTPAICRSSCAACRSARNRWYSDSSKAMSASASDDFSGPASFRATKVGHVGQPEILVQCREFLKLAFLPSRQTRGDTPVKRLNHELKLPKLSNPTE